ncbi:hypothetical protein CYMTET_20404 [Cymbomonas tetramitiformis]|uniref:Uncharacterized protein n=1 Tax=Cymbomonas tetramitiformis TaxID=36881 RepID=A0AAE0G450_9CHLO|nr:hypothetical protein CYMTET_20404 [Cymbomonas tetramitiformis]
MDPKDLRIRRIPCPSEPDISRLRGGGAPSNNKRQRTLGELASAYSASAEPREARIGDSEVIFNEKLRLEKELFTSNAHPRKRPRLMWNRCSHSGAGSLLADFHAGALGAEMLEAYMFIRHNWQYGFLRPSTEEIVKAYKLAHKDESDDESGIDTEEDDDCLGPANRQSRLFVEVQNTPIRAIIRGTISGRSGNTAQSLASC